MINFFAAPVKSTDEAENTRYHYELNQPLIQNSYISSGYELEQVETVQVRMKAPQIN